MKTICGILLALTFLFCLIGSLDAVSCQIAGDVGCKFSCFNINGICINGICNCNGK